MRRATPAALLLAGVLVLPVWGARAEDKIDCEKAIAQNDMNQCAEQEYEATDSMLNVTYRALIAQLDKKVQDELKEAQRAWIKFRDAECTYQSSADEGGSIYPLTYNGCLTEKTRARIKELSEPH